MVPSSDGVVDRKKYACAHLCYYEAKITLFKARNSRTKNKSKHTVGAGDPHQGPEQEPDSTGKIPPEGPDTTHRKALLECIRNELFPTCSWQGSPWPAWHSAPWGPPQSGSRRGRQRPGHHHSLQGSTYWSENNTLPPAPSKWFFTLLPRYARFFLYIHIYTYTHISHIFLAEFSPLLQYSISLFQPLHSTANCWCFALVETGFKKWVHIFPVSMGQKGKTDEYKHDIASFFYLCNSEQINFRELRYPTVLMILNIFRTWIVWVCKFTNSFNHHFRYLLTLTGIHDSYRYCPAVFRIQTFIRIKLTSWMWLQLVIFSFIKMNESARNFSQWKATPVV